MKRIRIEVCPQNGEWPWKVTKDGQKVANPITQRAAIHLARMLAMNLVARGETVTLKVKRPDGRVREEWTYPRSSDPRRTRG